MTTSRRPVLPLVLLALLAAAGCGTQRAAGSVEANGGGPQATPTTSATSATSSTSATPTAPATPSTPSDFPCPGETSAPTPPPTAHVRVIPGDHYAENHGFRIPLALHGQRRCDGLAAVADVRTALEPLRRRGDFAPDDEPTVTPTPGSCCIGKSIPRSSKAGVSVEACTRTTTTRVRRPIRPWPRCWNWMPRSCTPTSPS